MPVSHSIAWGIPPFHWEGRGGESLPRGKLPFSGKEKSFSFEDELVN